MKKTTIAIFIIISFLSSCSIHNGLTYNTNEHTTEVVLSKKNFKIVSSVKGEAEANYVFGIGAFTKKALIEEARTKMLEKANLIGSSKAVINETVELTHTFLPFYRKYNVTVSAYVIEFTE